MEQQVNTPSNEEILEKLKSFQVQTKLILPSFDFGQDYDHLMRTLLVFCDKHLMRESDVIQEIINKSEFSEDTYFFLEKIGYTGTKEELPADTHFYGNSLLLLTLNHGLPLFSDKIKGLFPGKEIDFDYLRDNYVILAKEYTTELINFLENHIDLEAMESKFGPQYELDLENWNQIQKNSLKNTLPFFLITETDEFMLVPDNLSFSGSIAGLNELSNSSVVGIYPVSIHDTELVKKCDLLLTNASEASLTSIVSPFCPRLHMHTLVFNLPVGQKIENQTKEKLDQTQFEIVNQLTAIFKSNIDSKTMFFRTPLSHLEEIIYGFIDFNALDDDKFNDPIDGYVDEEQTENQD